METDSTNPRSDAPGRTARPSLIATASSATGVGVEAGRSIAAQLAARLQGSPAAAACVFIGRANVPHTESIVASVHEALGRAVTVGVTAAGTIGSISETESDEGLSAFAIAHRGAYARIFTSDELPRGLRGEPDPANLASAMHVTDQTRLVLFFADPFSVPVLNLTPSLSEAIAQATNGKASLIGGMASSGEKAADNRLATAVAGVVTSRDAGAVGLTLAGDFAVDTAVSQGCRAIGQNMVITKSQSNLILQLGGRSAAEVLQEVCEDLEGDRRKRLAGGLFIGRVVSEYRDHFGPGDYLIRGVVGVEESTGAVAVDDLVRVGQTVRFHLRDREAAVRDLELMMSARAVHGTPAGGLLITCNGRGESFFGVPNRDVMTVQRAFRASEAAESAAKPGAAVIAEADAIPMAGFFAAGELGPVGGESRLHSQSAVVALFRDGASPL